MAIPNPEIYDPTEEIIDEVSAIYGLNPDITPEAIEASYPPRDLPEGAMVTRMAPSPTGEMHIGSVYTALACAGLAKATNGVFFLRVEDTDSKREVAGATERIIESLDDFGINVDEGPEIGGNYGPYIQSERAPIYQAYALKLVRQGKAYICFSTEEEIAEIAARQEQLKVPRGHYGQWSKWRDAEPELVLEEFLKGTPFVIRLKNNNLLAMTDKPDQVVFDDYIRGEMAMPVEYKDAVLIKGKNAKGSYLPTYHFAHPIDDHLMGTTHVIRGIEWMSSTPLHLELFSALGWKAPAYGHISTIDKKVITEFENESGEVRTVVSQRKLSKREDTEIALLSRYFQRGYPTVSIKAYLLSLLDSQFEVWRLANPHEPLSEYRFSPKGIKKSNNALYDPNKLASISKEEIGNMSAEEVYSHVLNWARNYGREAIEQALSDKEYALAVFGIERGGAKPRKDLVTWVDVPDKLGFFFDELYAGMIDSSAISRFDHEVIAGVVDQVISKYSAELSLEDWQKLMLEVASDNGFATDNKLYKANPETYKGSRADIFTIIRTLIAGRNISPDLYSVMKVMGKDRLSKRLEKSLAQLEPAGQ